MFDYHATLVKVIDGDTFDVDVDLGMHVHTATRLRLLGINAPEVSTPEGKAARDWARSILPIGAFLVIHTSKDPGDKFGRWLATVSLPDGTDYAELAVKTGHAVVWDGSGPRPV